MSNLSSKTLLDFQKSCGIPLQDQIILLNNPGFFAGYSPLIHPFARVRSQSTIMRSITGAIRRIQHQFVKIPAENDRLFLGYFDTSLDKPESLIRAIFKLISRSPERRFTLAVGKGDYELGKNIAEQLPDNLDHLVGNNLNFDHPRMKYLPMGRDFRNYHLLKNHVPEWKKTVLCYCNFSIDTHEYRKDIYAALQSKSFIKFEHMGNFLSYPISREDFIRSLGEAKFCVCPRGNAFDTFRMWDCLYSGTIPIVVREARFHELLQDLPILFLDDYRDFSVLTADYLERLSQQFLVKKFNYAKLTRQYWLGVNTPQ